VGRRAVPKVDPRIDLSHQLHQLSDLPRPWDPTVCFGRQAPLEVEVGSGKGLFLLTAAREHPEHDFLGCEIAGKYARLAAARLARQGLGNARLVHGDAARLLTEVLPDRCAVAVHIYFPDPWWKKRHHKRRIMNESFLAQVQRILTGGGALHFWTDVPEYFEKSLAMLGGLPGWSGPQSVAERQAAHDLDYRTHFERRMRIHQRSVYRAQFRKE
jgi:tRNA (guanine-N7-)-methyltransferase